MNADLASKTPIFKMGDKFKVQGATWTVISVALDGSKIVAEADDKQVPATNMFDISELRGGG